MKNSIDHFEDETISLKEVTQEINNLYEYYIHRLERQPEWNYNFSDALNDLLKVLSLKVDAKPFGNDCQHPGCKDKAIGRYNIDDGLTLYLCKKHIDEELKQYEE